MKTIFLWLRVVMLITLCANMTAASPTEGDPIHNLLFPPEVLIHHHKEIGLTKSQVEWIHARLEEAGPKAQERQLRVQQAMERLAGLLSAEKVDVEVTLNQLDEVLALEKDLKHLHLRLMIQIRNELTSKQLQIAEKIKRNLRATAGLTPSILEQRLKAKISRIEKEVKSRAEAGQPPFDAVELMQNFPQLMESKQVKQAEALLDRVINLLGIDK